VIDYALLRLHQLHSVSLSTETDTFVEQCASGGGRLDVKTGRKPSKIEEIGDASTKSGIAPIDGFTIR